MVSHVAMIEHSSDMLNFSSDELLVNIMFGSLGTRKYAPRALEEYGFLCRKAPGLKDLVARDAREATPRYVAFPMT